MVKTVDAALFQRMVIHGAAKINYLKQPINDLNVFPVPDGDTGTNMSLTFSAAATEMKKKNFDTVVLMITDVLLDGTQLLFVGDEDTIKQAFNMRPDAENCAFLPKILSRKKQVIPMLSALWG